jgi:hypothetical protein
MLKVLSNVPFEDLIRKDHSTTGNGGEIPSGPDGIKAPDAKPQIPCHVLEIRARRELDLEPTLV